MLHITGKNNWWILAEFSRIFLWASIQKFLLVKDEKVSLAESRGVDGEDRESDVLKFSDMILCPSMLSNIFLGFYRKIILGD